MPRNRMNVDRDVKIDEIVTVAASVIRGSGYAALTIQGVAGELGLARGAILWYFPSRDDLFAAAAQRVFTETFLNPPPRTRLQARISWAVDRLDELRQVIVDLQGRAILSASTAAVHRELLSGLHRALRASVATAVPNDRVEVVTESLGVFVVGLLAEPRPKPERDRLISFMVDRVIA